MKIFFDFCYLHVFVLCFFSNDNLTKTRANGARKNKTLVFRSDVGSPQKTFNLN